MTLSGVCSKAEPCAESSIKSLQSVAMVIWVVVMLLCVTPLGSPEVQNDTWCDEDNEATVLDENEAWTETSNAAREETWKDKSQNVAVNETTDFVNEVGNETTNDDIAPETSNQDDRVLVPGTSALLTPDMLSCLQLRQAPSLHDLWAHLLRVVAEHALDFLFSTVMGITGRL